MMGKWFALGVAALLTAQASALPVEKTFEPAVPWAFERLSPRSLEAQGRWRQIMETVADGWVRRMAETKDPVFHTILYEKKWDKVWIDAAALGIYNAGGIAQLGCQLPNSYIGQEYRNNWLPKLLASQLPTGYMGAGFHEDTFDWNVAKGERFKTPIPKYELLNAELLLELLLYEYEFSGSKEVFEAARRFGEFLAVDFLPPDQYDPQLKTPHHIAIFRGSMLELYRYTGDERILKHLEHYYNSMAGSFRTWMTRKVFHHHLPDLCYTIQGPITMYHATGNQELRELFLQGYDNIRDFALQTSGVPTGIEITLEKGPRKGTEHCGVVEWMNACTQLLRSTGQVRFADTTERCFFNAYLGSKKPDGLSLQYYHYMNQLFATRWTGQYLRNYEPSDTFNGRFAMRHSPGCCNAITSKALPQHLRSAVLRSQDDGYAFVFYGPYDLNDTHPAAGSVQIRQTGDYPFEEKITLLIDHIEKSVELPLHFRIPGWCRSAAVSVNSRKLDIDTAPGTFAKVQRIWNSGDTIELTFDVPITLDVQRQPGAGTGTAIVRGPLVFVLPVTADWQYIGKEPPGPGNANEDWNVVPKGTTVWNIALELDRNNPERTLQKVVFSPEQAKTYGWGGAPYGYKLWARVLPDWQYDRQNGNSVTPGKPLQITPSDQRIEVMLVPFGLTQLRMTVLPFLNAPPPAIIEHGKGDTDV